MKYIVDTVTSQAYWRYVLFSRVGARTVLAIFGGFWLLIESLDFFGVYTRDQYGSYGFIVVMAAAVVVAILFRHPIRSIVVSFPKNDFCVEVRIGNIFDAAGAIMVSTNTIFESDVAGGKISPDSLQGQFTAKYYTGDQKTLIETIKTKLNGLDGPPYPMGTTIPVNTHGKTFYFVAMAELNEQGTASTTPRFIEKAMDGLWRYVRESGELQELVVPVIGTARGRLEIPRKKMIEKIAESFVNASLDRKFTDRLVIMVHPEDAHRFQINLYDIKDNLNHVLIGR
ncbi:MAG: macro domain-containing protein [Thermodesulfobacteriota bacterium]